MEVSGLTGGRMAGNVAAGKCRTIVLWQSHLDLATYSRLQQIYYGAEDLRQF
jgi:hypothetical protein